MRTHQLVLTIILLMSILLTQISGAETRLPVPSKADVDDAKKLVAEVYREEYVAAKTPQERIQLARKLMQDAIATSDDSTSRYVLLQISQELFVRESSVNETFQVIDLLCKEYVVQEREFKDSAAREFYKRGVPDDESNQALFAVTDELIAEWIAVDRYDAADSLLQIALGYARKQKNLPVAKRWMDQARDVRLVQQQFERVKDAIKRLEESPTDEAANLAVGRFLCFYKGRWDLGIPMLALASDATLGLLAKEELKTDPDALAIADRWWELADTFDGLAKRQAQVHAATWYRKAIPGLTGLPKAKAEQRLRVVGVDGLPSNAKQPQGDPSQPIRIAARKVATIGGFDPAFAITAVVYSPDGEVIAAIDNKSVLLWSVRRNSEIGRLSGATGQLFSLVFSHGGNNIAGGGADKTIRIWDVKELRLTTTIEDLDDSVTSLAYSPDDTILVSSANGFAAEFWTLSGRRVNRIPQASAFAFSPVGKEIAIVNDGKSQVCKIANGESLFEVNGLRKDPRLVRYSPDGRSLAVLYIAGDRHLDIIDLKKRDVRTTLNFTDSVFSFAFSPDSAILATVGQGKVTLWNARTGQELQEIKVGSVAWSVAFSPNGKHFAFSDSGRVEVWEIEERS